MGGGYPKWAKSAFRNHLGGSNDYERGGGGGWVENLYFGYYVICECSLTSRLISCALDIVWHSPLALFVGKVLDLGDLV